MHLFDQLALSRRCQFHAPVSVPPEKEHVIPIRYETELIPRASLDARGKFGSLSGTKFRFLDRAEGTDRETTG
jgi:hypothetical protein